MQLSAVLSTCALLVASAAAVGKHHKSRSTSDGAGKEYMRRLQPYRPAKRIDIGIKEFRIPGEHIYGPLKKNAKHGIQRKKSTNEAKHEKGCKRNGKKKCCRKSKGYGRRVFNSISSSSSSSRTISMSISFSEEDDALFGSCDKPAVVYHRRHFSRHLDRRRRSRSRSRTRAANPIPIRG